MIRLAVLLLLTTVGCIDSTRCRTVGSETCCREWRTMLLDARPKGPEICREKR